MWVRKSELKDTLSVRVQVTQLGYLNRQSCEKGYIFGIRILMPMHLWETVLYLHFPSPIVSGTTECTETFKQFTEKSETTHTKKLRVFWGFQTFSFKLLDFAVILPKTKRQKVLTEYSSKVLLFIDVWALLESEESKVAETRIAYCEKFRAMQGTFDKKFSK